jgi:hypothetical protein
VSYFKLEIINELLHFSKTGQRSFSGIIGDCLKECGQYCPFSHGRQTNTECYKTNPAICDLLLLLKKYSLCLEYLGVNVYGVRTLHEEIEDLKSPKINYNLKVFKGNLASILATIKLYEKEVYEKISLLTCEECGRLDEAINTFENYCYYSSVIMAVSAVEARLHYLIFTKNSSIYNKFFKDKTLGQIIKLLDPNEYKDPKFKTIKKNLPLSYKPIIEVLNIYRVFSAHPKTKKIDFKTAQSILNFSFAFLLSDEARIKNKKLLIHK